MSHGDLARFLEVTMDGLGTLARVDAGCDGLLTQNLSACVAYAFVGEHGIALCHDSGGLDHDTLVPMLANCGAIHAVHFAFSDHASNQRSLARHIGRRDALIDRLGARLGECVSHSYSIFRLYRDGRFGEGGTLGDRRQFTLDPPPGAEVRVAANRRRAFEADGPVAPDLQWDMGRPTPLPAWA